MTACFFWLTLYLHKYHEVGVKSRMNSIFCTAYIIKMGVTVAMVLFFIFLALSRVFLGEHSYNQVFFGSQLGIAFAVVLHFLVKPVLKKLPSWARSRYGINKERGLYQISTSYMGCALILTTILPIVAATIVWVYGSQKEIDPELQKSIDQRIKAFCPEN